MNRYGHVLILALVLSMFGGALTASAQSSEPQKIEVAEPLTYTRLYADSTGASHFEDVVFSFDLVDWAPPAPPISVSEIFDSYAVFVISSPSGWRGDWHPAPRRQFVIILSGELEVEVSNGEKRRFGAGGVILVEDNTGKGHISRMMSDHRGYCVVVPIDDNE